MDDVSEVISRLLDEKNWETLTGVDAVPAFAMDAVVLLKSQQAEIERLTKPAGGTWIQKADATGHEYSMCSACETVINTPDGCGGYYKLDMTGAKYCPNCGAKMD